MKFKLETTHTINKPNLYVRFNHNQEEKIRKIAQENHLTIASIVRQMVEHCLNEMEKK